MAYVGFGSLLAGTILLVVALAMLLSNLNDIRRERQLRRTPGVSVAEALRTGDRVAVRGTITPGPAGLLQAPLSRRPCVWWSVRVDRIHRTGSARPFTTVVDVNSGTPFALTDETGTLLIQGRMAEGWALPRSAPLMRSAAAETSGPLIWQPMAEVTIRQTGGRKGSHHFTPLVEAGIASWKELSPSGNLVRFDIRETVLTPGQAATAVGRRYVSKVHGPMLRRPPRQLGGLRPETREELLAAYERDRPEKARAIVGLTVLGVALAGPGLLILLALSAG